METNTDALIYAELEELKAEAAKTGDWTAYAELKAVARSRRRRWS